MSNHDKKSAKATMTIRKYETTPYDEPPEGPALMKVHVEENYSGDIEGIGMLEFLQATRSNGSANFVGMKRIIGKLGGKEGSFLLQDTGTFEGKNLSGNWLVLPDSGTGELVGLHGEGGIRASVDDSVHNVHLNYWFE